VETNPNINDSYRDAISSIVAGIGLQKACMSSLRSACNKGPKLQKLSAKLQAEVSEAFALGLVDAPLCGVLLQPYDEILDKITTMVDALELNPLSLDEILTEAIVTTSRALAEIRKEIQVAQDKQIAIEKESRRKAEAKSKLVKRIQKKKEIAELKRLKEDADRRQLRNRIVSYSKRRFLNLTFAVLATFCFFEIFSSWNSLQSSLSLLLILAGVIGPLNIYRLSKASLDGKTVKLIQFRTTLSFEIGGAVGVIQIICGVIISFILWILGKQSPLWSLILPIGWRGLIGFFITMPSTLIVAWLWGGFYAGVAAKRILGRQQISDLSAPLKIDVDHPPS
jgi:hypothetical protein